MRCAQTAQGVEQGRTFDLGIRGARGRGEPDKEGTNRTRAIVSGLGKGTQYRPVTDHLAYPVRGDELRHPLDHIGGHAALSARFEQPSERRHRVVGQDRDGGTAQPRSVAVRVRPRRRSRRRPGGLLAPRTHDASHDGRRHRLAELRTRKDLRPEEEAGGQNRLHAYTGFPVPDQIDQGARQARRRRSQRFFDRQQRVPSELRMGVLEQSEKPFGIESVETGQRPHRVKAAHRGARSGHALPQGSNQRLRWPAAVVFDEEPLRGETTPPIFVAKRFDQLSGPGPVEPVEVLGPGRQTARRDHPIDPSAVIALVQVERGLHRVGNPLRVLDHAAVHVEHVEGAVRTNVKIDGTEQRIGRGQELDARPPATRLGGRAGRVDNRTVHHVRRRIGDEDVKAPVRQPGDIESAASVGGDRAGRGEPARLLRVVGPGLPVPDREQFGGTAIGVGRQAQAGILPGSRQPAEVAARNDELTQVIQVVGAESPAPGSERHPEPAGAAAGPLEAARLPLSPEVDPEIVLADVDRLVRRVGPERAGAIAAVDTVNPVVQAVAERVHVVLRVAFGEAAEQDITPVGPPVAVRILEVENVRRRRDQQSTTPGQDRVRHAEVVREQTPDVPAAVPVPVRQGDDAGRPLHVRIAGQLEHEGPAPLVESEVDRVDDDRLGRREFNFEGRVDFEARRHPVGRGRRTGGESYCRGRRRRAADAAAQGTPTRRRWKRPLRRPPAAGRRA